MPSYGTYEAFLLATEPHARHEHRPTWIAGFWVCPCGETKISKSIILPEFTPPGARGDGVDEETRAHLASRGSFETVDPLERAAVRPLERVGAGEGWAPWERD